MADKILTCKKCGSQFYFTEGEQRFYKSKGLNIPKYCKNCRGQKREQKELRNEIQHTPKACSTCYFSDVPSSNVAFYGESRYAMYYGEYEYYYTCSRTGNSLANDAPCKYWQKR